MPIDQVYSYTIPDWLDIDNGDMVMVPIRGRHSHAVVWNVREDLSENLKPVASKIDLPSIPKESRDLIDWVASYTVTPRGSLLRMAISAPKALAPEKPKVGYVLNLEGSSARITISRKKVIDALKHITEPLGVEHIAACANVSESIVRGMIKGGFFLLAEIEKSGHPKLFFESVSLSNEQAEGAVTLIDAVLKEQFQTFLLDGVTGSGKTEVYFEAIAQALKQGKQALILLPEIALSTQWMHRFRQRFGNDPAVWHSDLTETQRRSTWRAIIKNETSVIVGARSALFLPYRKLGVIVVDEEHETSYKQEEGVLYNARDMAIVRAKLSNIPVILASATPSLESMWNAAKGRYKHLKLTSRHGSAQMPEVSLIDMRLQKNDPNEKRFWLSANLRDNMRQTLESGEQVMLFLNRRGYAPMILCKSCGEKIECPNCSAWLVMHKTSQSLLCHYCGHNTSIPSECKKCHDTESMVPCGPGVERLAEEVATFFPDQRINVMASDTMTSSKILNKLIDDVHSGKVNILIGTQMVAKGHHFPGLTLVGVVDADIGLGGGDLRACERTYQMLHQVSGRAGRAEKPGRVLMQTYHPDHPVMQALISDDRDSFIEIETQNRKMQELPPFGKLVGVIVSALSPQQAELVARELAQNAPRFNGIEVLGPAPAPMTKVRNKYRWRLLLKTSSDIKVQPIIRQWRSMVNIPPQVRVQFDIDPYSFW